MDLAEEIIIALSYESTKEDWRNKHESKEFRFVKQLGYTIGSPITNDKGCRCIERFFMLAHAYSRDNEKTNLKQKQMESKFKFKDSIVLGFGGSHYTNANLTDEKAIEILKSNKANLANFETYPDDWELMIGDKKVVEEVIVSERELELNELELPELFAIAQELADDNEDLTMVGARSKEKKVIKFILDNEK